MIVPGLARGRWVIAAPRPWHGLGNRIRSVLGARVLAQRHDRQFAYAWPTGRKFGARLDDLWTIADPTVPEPVVRLTALRYPFRDASLSWVAEAQSQRVWQVRTAHALDFADGTSAWEPELQSLSPVADIAQRVTDLHDRHLGDVPYVGVMIRTHSVAHSATIETSPTEWFVDRMRQLRSAHPTLRFFVSSDTEEALDVVSRSVGGCVGQRDKGPYNSRRALKASVVDLYLLAGSVHIVGPHHSSFPELAQRLAGPRLAMETPTTEERSADLDDLSRPPDPLKPHLRVPTTL